MNETPRSGGPPGDTEQSILSHLIELRTRLIRCACCIVVLLVPLSLFRNELYETLARPLMRFLPEGTSMQAIGPASTFLVPFMTSMFAALILSVPYLFYQLWAFVAPGLYQNERRLVLPLLASSTLLFYAGIAFAYFVIFPLIFSFFVSTAPDGIQVATDIKQYFSFILVLFIAFGVTFEIPIATFLLIRTGLVELETLKKQRRYIFLGAFVVGMLLTPADPFSQSALAIPMYLLFEAGLLASKWLTPEQPHEQGENYANQ